MLPKRELKENEVHHFNFTILNNFAANYSESFLLSCIDHFVGEYGQAVFKACYDVSKISVSAQFGPHLFPVEYDLLMKAIQLGYTQVLTRLLALGAPVDGSYTCKTDPRVNNLSSLMRALDPPNIAILEILLENNANILATNELGVTVMAYDAPPEIFEKLLNYAKKKYCLYKLLQKETVFHSTIYQICAINANVDKLRLLMQVHDYHTIIDMREFIGYLRHGAWRNPNKAQAINQIISEISIQIRQFFAKTKTPLLALNPAKLTTAHAYHVLFGNISYQSLTPKLQAIQRSLAQFFSLLYTAAPCIQYLSFFNAEFNRYYKEKYLTDFPYLDISTYTIKEIDGLHYPIPHRDFTGFKKFSVLNEFLMLLFNKHGIAQQGFEAVGYIPQQPAQQIMKRGDLFLEARTGDNLFHGKISHMLQRVILLYAIESGQISLTHLTDNDVVTLTIHDLLQGMLDIKECNTDNNLFIPLCDRRYLTHVSFTDPHRLTSVVMAQGKELGMEALADAMIDTFCKGLLEYLDIYNSILPKITMERFVEELNDLKLGTFISDPLFIRETISRCIKKQKVLVEAGENHALIKKNYQVNLLFKPRSYTENEKQLNKKQRLG